MTGIRRRYLKRARGCELGEAGAKYRRGAHRNIVFGCRKTQRLPCIEGKGGDNPSAPSLHFGRVDEECWTVRLWTPTIRERFAQRIGLAEPLIAKPIIIVPSPANPRRLQRLFECDRTIELGNTKKRNRWRKSGKRDAAKTGERKSLPTILLATSLNEKSWALSVCIPHGDSARKRSSLCFIFFVRPLKMTDPTLPPDTELIANK